MTTPHLRSCHRAVSTSSARGTAVTGRYSPYERTCGDGTANVSLTSHHTPLRCRRPLEALYGSAAWAAFSKVSDKVRRKVLGSRDGSVARLGDRPPFLFSRPPRGVTVVGLGVRAATSSTPRPLQPSNPSFNPPTLQPFIQPFNPSTLQPSNPPTFQPFNPPTLQPSDPPTRPTSFRSCAARSPR